MIAARRERNLTQHQMAKLLALKGASQPEISKWERGEQFPTNPYEVFEIERRLGFSPGELSAHLGFVPTEALGSVVADLAADPTLDDEGRDATLAVYRISQRQRRRP